MNEKDLERRCQELEIALRESEKRFQLLMDIFPATVFQADPYGYATYVNNERWREWTGLPDDSWEREGWRFGIYDEDTELVLASWRTATTQQTQWRQEFRFVHQNGRISWILGIAAPFFAENGRFLGYLGACADISNQKETELQLRESEKRFRSIIEHSVDGIVLADEHGRIIEWNQGMTHITRYARERMLGLTLWEMNYQLSPESSRSPKRQQELQNTFATFYATGNAPWLNRLEEQLLQQANGNLCTVQVLTFPIPTDHGIMVGSIFRDMTEKIEQDKQLRHQERMATVGQLAAGIAHDFNNILAVIMLYADMMLRSPTLPTTIVEPVQTIVQQASRAAELTQQILDFSRRTVLEKRLVDLRPLLHNLVQLWQRTLPAHIHIDATTGQDNVIIHADPTRIQQVLMNLVVNARDAMPQNGRLHLSLQRLTQEQIVPGLDPQIKEWIKLSVQDNGTGIPDYAIPRLFEPFFTTKEPGKGTGLGLAQVYGIVKQHDGHITVDSKEGLGATFNLYFPALNRQEQAPVSLKTIGLHTGQNETILLIEDDEDVRQALASSLISLNYRVIIAHDGREGLEICRQYPQQIDLILCDIVMPHINGYQLFTHLPDEVQRKPFVLMTGHPLDDNTLRPNLGHGRTIPWLMKPISLEQLSQLLSELLPK